MKEPADLETLIREAAGLRRLAVELVGEGAADDVVQDALTAGLRSAPSDEGSVRPWLARVVKNLAASRHRGTARRAGRERDAARREGVPSASELVERMEVQRVVAEEVLQLSDPYRAAILAVHFEGVGAEEYAKSRGVPGATVRSWTKRGLEMLRGRLDRRFGGDRNTWSACLLGLIEPAARAGLAWKTLAAAFVVLASPLGVAWWASAKDAGSTSARTPSASLARVEPDERTGLPTPEGAAANAQPLERVTTRTALGAQSAPALGRIVGRVVWLNDGAPAAGIGVRLVAETYDRSSGEPLRAVTESDGRFAFDPLPPGTHEVRLDRADVSRKLVLDAGATATADLALPPGTEVVGRVLTLDGTPVAGASIWMRESSRTWVGRVATSAPDGSYVVPGVDVWSPIFARSPGFSPSALRQLMPGRDEHAKSCTIDLFLGGPPGRVAGRVLGSDGGPVAHASVELIDLGGGGVDPSGENVDRSVTTRTASDDDGRFEFADATPGLYRVGVFARGSPERFEDVSVLPGRTTRIEVELPPTARIRGRILDALGNPAQGAFVTATSLECVARTTIHSDADGRYDTGHVPAGRIRVTAQHKSWRIAEHEFELAANGEVDWSPTLAAFASIRGRFVDEAGRPLEGFTVQASGGNKPTARTDAEGRFELHGRDDRAHTLSVSDGTREVVRRGGVWPGDPEVLVVREARTARVLGRVVDADGKPLAGEQVQIDGRPLRTGELGEFEFDALAPGRHRLGPAHTRVQNETFLELDLSLGEVRDIGDVVFPGRGALLVRVSSAEGVPIGWVRPVVRKLGAPRQWLVQRGWDERGTWRVEDLRPGAYELTGTGSGAALEAHPFTIEAGSTTELDVELRFGTTLRCDVRAAPGGARLTSVTAEVLRADGSRVGERAWDWRTSIEPDTVLCLRPGRHEIVVTEVDGRRGSAWIDVPAPGGLVPTVRVEVR